MNIPKKVKIGGKTYSIKITDKMNLGKFNVSAEIDFYNLIIRIAPNSKDKVMADFIHELIHGILDFLGYKNHNEKKVDELANALLMVIRDNPEIVEWWQQ